MSLLRHKLFEHSPPEEPIKADNHSYISTLPDHELRLIDNAYLSDFQLHEIKLVL